MAEHESTSIGRLGKILRYLPSTLNALRLLLLFLVLTIGAYWIYFHVAQSRTVIVDAKTGALEITLSAALSGKSFRSVFICQRGERTDGASQEPPPVPIGCPPTHKLYGPFESETLTFPIGTKLKLASLPKSLRIEVVSLPDARENGQQYVGTEIAKMVGGAYVIVGLEAARAFGTLRLEGRLRLGASHRETDHISIIDGRYQIRGYTPIGLVGGDMRELKAGTLQAGAFVRFIEDEDQTAKGALAVILEDPDDTLMRVTAISEHDTSNLAISYYFTKEVIVRPSFIEAVSIDPLFQLLATMLGMFVGYGWLRRVFIS